MKTRRNSSKRSNPREPAVTIAKMSSHRSLANLLQNSHRIINHTTPRTRVASRSNSLSTSMPKSSYPKPRCPKLWPSPQRRSPRSLSRLPLLSTSLSISRLIRKTRRNSSNTMKSTTMRNRRRSQQRWQITWIKAVPNIRSSLRDQKAEQKNRLVSD